MWFLNSRLILLSVQNVVQVRLVRPLHVLHARQTHACLDNMRQESCPLLQQAGPCNAQPFRACRMLITTSMLRVPACGSCTHSSVGCSLPSSTSMAGVCMHSAGTFLVQRCKMLTRPHALMCRLPGACPHSIREGQWQNDRAVCAHIVLAVEGLPVVRQREHDLDAVDWEAWSSTKSRPRNAVSLYRPAWGSQWYHDRFSRPANTAFVAQAPARKPPWLPHCKSLCPLQHMLVHGGAHPAALPPVEAHDSRPAVQEPELHALRRGGHAQGRRLGLDLHAMQVYCRRRPAVAVMSD